MLWKSVARMRLIMKRSENFRFVFVTPEKCFRSECSSQGRRHSFTIMYRVAGGWRDFLRFEESDSALTHHLDSYESRCRVAHDMKNGKFDFLSSFHKFWASKVFFSLQNFTQGQFRQAGQLIPAVSGYLRWDETLNRLTSLSLIVKNL